MKYKVKRAIKAKGEEGDLTPEGTELLLLAEISFTEEIRKEAMNNGARYADKMYISYNKEFQNTVAMVDWKIGSINDELIEIELEGIEENLAELKGIGFKTY